MPLYNIILLLQFRDITLQLRNHDIIPKHFRDKRHRTPAQKLPLKREQKLEPPDLAGSRGMLKIHSVAK